MQASLPSARQVLGSNLELQPREGYSSFSNFNKNNEEVLHI